jgi:O-antigen/teichoic acid export membrane protein
MLQYGSVVTLNGMVTYLACNLDKILLGRFWGAATLGIYGRAYQLISLPNENFNSTIGLVAVPALSRLQNDPERLRNYFLKGYGLMLSLVMPVTAGCALFAEDIILVFLGQKWSAAVPVFRLLAPAILALTLINPVGWLMLATGRATRGLKIALVSTPIVILAYTIGLRYGAEGVAAGCSIAAVLLVAPISFWATRGTSITLTNLLKVVLRPFLSILIAAGAALTGLGFVRFLDIPLFRLVAVSTVFFGVYATVLWFGMGQKTIYLGLLQELSIWPFSRRRSPESRQAGEPRMDKPANFSTTSAPS